MGVDNIWLPSPYQLLEISVTAKIPNWCKLSYEIGCFNQLNPSMLLGAITQGTLRTVNWPKDKGDIIARLNLPLTRENRVFLRPT
jgi:hypothetical protein